MYIGRWSDMFLVVSYYRKIGYQYFYGKCPPLLVHLVLHTVQSLYRQAVSLQAKFKRKIKRVIYSSYQPPQPVYTTITPEPIVLDDFKSAHFHKHELEARAFPTRG
jgi:hypothetical protein